MLAGTAPGAPLHPSLADIPTPRVGVLAVLDHRIDTALLAGLARELPDVSLVLVGPRAAGFDPARLRGLANVHLRPGVAPDETPSVLAGFQVGLIPFVRSRFTAAIQPVKGWEYLAAGLPVVSTGFAPLDELAGFATLADSASATAAAIRTALRSSDAEARRAFAATAAWTARADAWREVLDA